MLFKSRLALFQNLYFVFKLGILMNDFILLQFKFLHMSFSIEGFPDLKVSIKIVSMFCC